MSEWHIPGTHSEAAAVMAAHKAARNTHTHLGDQSFSTGSASSRVQDSHLGAAVCTLHSILLKQKDTCSDRYLL